MNSLRKLVAVMAAAALVGGTAGSGAAFAAASPDFPVLQKAAVDESQGGLDALSSDPEDPAGLDSESLSDPRDGAEASEIGGANGPLAGPAQERTAPFPARSIVREGNTVYANGTPIVIKKGSDGQAYVFDGTGTAKLDETPFSGAPTVYGGGKGVAVEGDTSVTVDGVLVSKLVGGGLNASVSGNVHVVVKNANTSTLYGGGYSDGAGNADVEGNVTIDLTGTGAKTGVIGGGYATASKGDASADVSGSVTISCDDFNHGAGSSMQGGGTASAPGVYDASACVGSVSLTGAGRTYVVRAGGNASTTGEGAACADVCGAIALQLSDVDAREIYGGGYASGARAQANAGSIDVFVEGGEVMILQGGGESSKGGAADVRGAIATKLKGCWNLYGYVLGGGVASGGGSSTAASASTTLENCDVPVEEQFGSPVAAAIYGGGEASGLGSRADVAGSVELKIGGGAMAGSLYGGGEASGGATASAGSASVECKNVSGSVYDGATYVPSLFLAGEADTDSAASFGAFPVAATIDGCPLEHLWGAVSDGQPLEVAGATSVVLRGSSTLSTLACVDSVDIDALLSIVAFKENAEGPTTVDAHGMGKDDPVVVCDDPDLKAEWIALRDGELSYAVEDGKSVWRIASRSASVDVSADVTAVPSVSIDNEQDVLDGLMTDDDRAALDAGSPVSFELSVRELQPDEVGEEERQAVLDAMSSNGLSLFRHLDVTFAKQVGDQQTQLHEVGCPLRLVFAVPGELLAQEGEHPRAFSIVRVHRADDGGLETSVLPDLDDADETVTVETDRFSVYALAYAQPTGGSGGNHDGSGEVLDGASGTLPGGETKSALASTGDAAQSVLAACGVLALGAAVVAGCALKRARNESRR